MSLKPMTVNTALKNAMIFESDDEDDYRLETATAARQLISPSRSNLKIVGRATASSRLLRSVPYQRGSSGVWVETDMRRTSVQPTSRPDQLRLPTPEGERDDGSETSSTASFGAASRTDKPNGEFRVKKELDKEILGRRQKQIDYGKNTIGYDNYIRTVPRSERKQDDPRTPDKNRVYSRRAFDGLIKEWRLKLHKYDNV